MTLDFTLEQQKLKLALSGDYLNFDDEDAKLRLLEALRGGGVCSVSVNASGLGSWDSTLVVVLYELVRECLRCNVKISYEKFPPNLRRLIDLAFMVDRKPSRPRSVRLPWLEALGNFGLSVWQSIKKGMGFIHQSLKSFRRWLAASAVMRKVDFLFALQDCSYKAVGIVSLVSFMVGLILAFVGAVQLKTFGAQIYVASLVAIGMTRIMGAIMTGIILAGRTGASYAAVIGTMQVNEEIDALTTLGVAPSDYLIMPRVLALTAMTPLLVLYSDFMGIMGGFIVGVGILGLDPMEYYTFTQKGFNINNLWVGMVHGAVYGMLIAITGCYQGLRCGRNAEAVGKATTSAVVYSIVGIVLSTAVLTILCNILNI